MEGTGPERPHLLVHCPSFHTLRPGLWLGRFFLGNMMADIDADLRLILTTVKTIAVVGWSPKADRPSNGVARFLRTRGYRVIPVNPGQAGAESGLGELVRTSLAEIDGPVDMVDIFRRSEEVGPVVDEAVSIGAGVVWMQLGVINELAADTARKAGLKVVMNRCPAIEIPRLGL